MRITALAKHVRRAANSFSQAPFSKELRFRWMHAPYPMTYPVRVRSSEIIIQHVC